MAQSFMKHSAFPYAIAIHMAKIAAAYVDIAERDEVAIMLLAIALRAKTASISIWITCVRQVKSFFAKINNVFS